MGLDRRTFLKLAGVQTGALVAGAGTVEAMVAARGARGTGRAAGGTAPDVVVIGAGAFGGWTALYLRELGASVVLVDMYGPGNSRSTSGDETRGIRTTYGTRELWMRWASEAITRWRRWDEEWARPLQRRLFFPTGDLILRAEWDNFLEDNRKTMEKLRVRHEVLSIDEVAYRFPQIRLDGLGAALYEPDAGVARARRACESVAEVYQQKGGELRMARAELGRRAGGRLQDVTLAPGEPLSAQTFVFACGPWLPKVVPEAMADKLRLPLGHVYYFGTPAGDNRFAFPNMPSYNVPGVTGWPALGNDNRGFRVRTGGRPPEDPDVSDRWIDARFHEQPRKVLADRFPDLKDAPLLETRACHYEISISRNFIVDRHPGLENVWIAGGGNAEGFKFGPVIGEYIARRVLGMETDPALAEAFQLPEETYESPTD